MKIAQKQISMWRILGQAAISAAVAAASLLTPARLAADDQPTTAPTLAVAEELPANAPAATPAGDQPAAATQPAVAPDAAASTPPAVATQPVAATTVPAAQPANLIVDGLDANGDLNLTINKTALLRARFPLKLILPSQPEIADAAGDKRLGPDRVLVTGRKAGRTHITLIASGADGDESQSINVLVSPDLGMLPEQIKKMFPGSEVEATSANGAIILRGRVPNLQVADQIVSLAVPYSGGQGASVVNLMEVSGGQQVVLQVRFAEVSRSVTTNLGFNAFATDGTFRDGAANGSGGTPIGALATGQPFSVDASTTIFGAATAGKTAFEYFVDALRTNNLFRILAEPNLTTMSGHPASFLAGGEIPILVPQPGSGGATIFTILYKPFGVQLNFTPVALGDGRIRLDVAPEVSELDYAHAVTVSAGSAPVPGLTRRTLHTVVELNDGQTFALAGLLNNSVTASKNVTPLLGDLPILGTLFRSVRWERDETELVVLVTPHLAGGLNPNQVPKLPGEFWRYPNEAELFLNHDLGGPAADTRNSPGAKPSDYRGRHGFSPADANGSR